MTNLNEVFVMTRQFIRIATLLATAAALAACGGSDGGGTTIASAPLPNMSAPPTPPTVVGTTVIRTALPDTLANTTGTYNTIDLNRDGSVAPAGSVRLAVDNTAKTYTLTFQPAVSALTSAQFAFPADLGLKVDTVTKYSDGTSQTQTVVHPSSTAFTEITQGSGNRIEAVLLVGLPSYPSTAHYASFGIWNLDPQLQGSNGSYTSSGNQTGGFFALGNRTIPADIPLTGTAAYLVIDDTCNDYCQGIGNTKFAVDFGVHTIAAQYRIEERYSLNNGFDSTSVGASGSSQISNAGDFNIALSGTGTIHSVRNDGTVVPDSSMPVSGLIAGAFFGPKAAEIGGVYSVPFVVLVAGKVVADKTQGAFTAARPSP